MEIIKSDINFKIKKNRGKLHRISADQVDLGRELLQQVALRIEPTNRTQRKIFSIFLPDIYYLKVNEGCTLKSIARYLNEVGLKLSYSSVRVYYSKMLPERIQECISKIDELEEHYHAIKEKN